MEAKDVLGLEVNESKCELLTRGTDETDARNIHEVFKSVAPNVRLVNLNDAVLGVERSQLASLTA